KDLFAIDTQRIDPSLMKLNEKYPEFLGIFLDNILAISSPEGLRNYLSNYRPVYNAAQDVFGNMEDVKADLEKAFKHVKYYFPEYELPRKLLAVVGPIETRDDLARM